MANPHKGEVELKAGDTSYTLGFTNNAIVEIEQIFGGIGIGQVAANLGRIEVARALLWGALRKHHPKIDLFGAGEVLDEVEGGLTALADPLTRALRFRISGIAIDAPLDIEAD